MKPPFILVLGIDNTIIGDDTHCTLERDLLEVIFKACIKENNTLPTKCMNASIMDLQDELRDGLLRPNIGDFLTFLEKKFKMLEIFFYVEPYALSWTQMIIRSQIEKALKIKANKTILTDIDSLFEDIEKALLKKYPAIANSKKRLFTEHMIFINSHGKHSRQISCPKYDFRTYYDIPEKIIHKYKFPSSVFDNKETLKYLERTIPIYNPNGSIYQQSKDHYMIQHLFFSKLAEISNATLKPDTFFLDMIAAFEKIDLFTDKEIKKINML